MSSAQQYISKGFYSHSQIEGFVSVKNYIFVRNDQGKYLLLRFTNLSDFMVDSMEFTLIQMDSAGQILEKTNLRYADLVFAPGRTFTPDKGIPVNEFCADFKLQFTCVTSGDYLYRVAGKEVTVLYRPQSRSAEADMGAARTVWTSSIRPLKPGKQWLSVLCGICALILLIGLSVYQMYDRYRDATEETSPQQSENSSVAFISPDGE